MRSTLFFYAALICACSASPLATPTRGKYIVKLKSEASQVNFLGFVNDANNGQLTASNKVTHRYSPDVFNGFAGEFTDDFLASSIDNPDVEYIEEDGIMTIDHVQKNPPSWGLSRIGGRYLPSLKTPYVFPNNEGENVDVWVVDTGIQASHSDFEGRATMVKSFVAGEEATDLNGHGTHCAGTIGSKTYGVAKKAKLFGVKVLDQFGSGSFSNVIAGVNHACSNARVQDGAIKTVLSMSLGGPASQAVDDAIASCNRMGVVTCVAAGNNGSDACRKSPARAHTAVTVGATTRDDEIADYSNTGRCVTLYAPGSDITSLWIGKDGETNEISGTSMATPHVAGIAAVYMSGTKFTNPAQVKAALVNSSTKLKNLKPVGAELEKRIAFVFNEASEDKPVPPVGVAPVEPQVPWYCKLIPQKSALCKK